MYLKFDKISQGQIYEIIAKLHSFGTPCIYHVYTDTDFDDMPLYAITLDLNTLTYMDENSYARLLTEHHN